MPNSKKILLVVHRYAPYPGGSEAYVQNIAEELLARGYDVTVLAEQHHVSALLTGQYNKVNVTTNHDVLLSPKWDLIVVHGGDCSSQNVVHNYAANIPSPVLYLIVKPSISSSCMNGLYMHEYLGYSTHEDIEYIQRYQQWHKARRVRHGINLGESLGFKGNVIKPPGRLFVSAGGFWPHKGFMALAEAFNKAFAGTRNELWLYGYAQPENAPPQTANVLPLYNKSRTEIMDAINAADGYIMNSSEEGFGLVLLEASVNHCPWFAKDLAGANLMKEYGNIYKDEDDLMRMLISWDDWEERRMLKAEHAYDYVVKNHLIQNTVDDIEEVYNEAIHRKTIE